jgi:predicted nucleic acid-binding protein
MAIISKKVFIESSVFYAFINRADPKYPQAGAYFRYFAQEQFQVFTSYPVLDDVYIDIFEKISPSLARDFIRGLSLSSINVLYPTESDLKAALKTLINYRNSELTFKDAQTAVLANRNYISQICTFKYIHPLFGLSAFNLPL